MPSGNTLTAEPFFALLFPVLRDMREGDSAESSQVCRKVRLWKVPRAGLQEVPASAEAGPGTGAGLCPVPLSQEPSIFCCRPPTRQLVCLTLVSGETLMLGTGSHWLGGSHLSGYIPQSPLEPSWPFSPTCGWPLEGGYGLLRINSTCCWTLLGPWASLQMFMAPSVRKCNTLGKPVQRSLEMGVNGKNRDP